MVNAGAILQIKCGYYTSQRVVKTLAGLFMARHLQEDTTISVRGNASFLGSQAWDSAKRNSLWSLGGPALA